MFTLSMRLRFNTTSPAAKCAAVAAPSAVFDRRLAHHRRAVCITLTAREAPLVRPPIPVRVTPRISALAPGKTSITLLSVPEGDGHDLIRRRPGDLAGQTRSPPALASSSVLEPSVSA